jgi:hypothetical protein
MKRHILEIPCQVRKFPRASKKNLFKLEREVRRRLRRIPSKAFQNLG